MGLFRRSFRALLAVAMLGAVIVSWAVVRLPAGSSGGGPTPSASASSTDPFETTLGTQPRPGGATGAVPPARRGRAGTGSGGARAPGPTAGRHGEPSGPGGAVSTTTTMAPVGTGLPGATTTVPTTPAGALVWAPGAVDAGGAAAVPAEVAFIESAQLPDGAITTYPGSGRVDPYLGAYAAQGLAEAAAVTGDPADSAAAWRWLAWYAAAEGPGGITTDATVSGGGTVPTGALDATDATAGMFLVAADAAYATTRDTAALAAIEPGIRGAVGAITALQGSDGLTWATAGYHAVYLMDEAETYGGLVAAAHLAAAAGDGATSARASAAASAMAAGVAGLWDPATSSYDWAVAGDGVRTQTDWSVAYPDAMEQVWAVAFGLVPAGRAAGLMAAVVQHVPQWASPGASAILQTDAVRAPAPIGYWPVTAWALLSVGQGTAADTGAAGIRSAAAGSGWAWPYTPAVAGQLVVAAAGGVAVP